ncbi:translation elongation factor P Lys34:lysine transferase [Klebsiella pneumoniae]|nr:translation elongation factor P Lys34:lysine transferase [Klebsiella pneumoniae]
MSETATWQPSAPISNLLKRAAVMAEIRRFFTDRGVLEVETPCMSQATVTDIHLFPFRNPVSSARAILRGLTCT